MKVRIINESGFPNPQYETNGAAGCDLRNAGESRLVQPFERAFFDSGISVEIPEGYEAQVRGRSGLNRKHGIVCPVGTIDSDYRGSIGVTLYNLSHEAYLVKKGDKIAQLVFSPVVQAEWEETKELSETERGEGGFGHTGR